MVNQRPRLGLNVKLCLEGFRNFRLCLSGRSLQWKSKGQSLGNTRPARDVKHRSKWCRQVEIKSGSQSLLLGFVFLRKRHKPLLFALFMGTVTQIACILQSIWKFLIHRHMERGWILNSQPVVFIHTINSPGCKSQISICSPGFLPDSTPTAQNVPGETIISGWPRLTQSAPLLSRTPCQCMSLRATTPGRRQISGHSLWLVSPQDSAL